MTHDHVDGGIKKAITGPLKGLPPAPGAKGGEGGGKAGHIGQDRGRVGLDIAGALRNTGKLPSLDAFDVPEMASQALEGLRRGGHQHRKGADELLVEIALLTAEHAVAACQVAALAMARAAFELMDKPACEHGVESAGALSRLGQAMACVAMALAIADMVRQIELAAHFASFGDVQRCQVLCHLATDALAIAGACAPAPANLLLLELGAAFALAGLAADRWPGVHGHHDHSHGHAPGHHHRHPEDAAAEVTVEESVSVSVTITQKSEVAVRSAVAFCQQVQGQPA